MMSHMIFDADRERRRQIIHEIASWTMIAAAAALIIGLGVDVGMNWDAVVEALRK